MQFLSDLCHMQAAQAAGEVSRICAELVFGYTRHPAWDERRRRAASWRSELEDFEGTMPGIMAMVSMSCAMASSGESRPVRRLRGIERVPAAAEQAGPCA